MKLLKNRIFAIILTAVVIVGCCAYGFLTRPNETAADQTHLEYGKTNYSSYLDWIADEADLLSDETEQLVASYMGALDHGWGSIVAVVTEDSGGADLQTRAKDWAARGNLSGRDMVLLLDASSGRWYMQPGADIGPYVDQTLTTTVTACFDGRSVTEDADEILTDLFPDLYSWYESTLTVQEDSGGTPILLAFGFVALLILIIAVASAASLGRGGRGGNSGGGSDNTVRHRRSGPTIFWGPTIFFPGRFGGPFGPPHGRPGRHRPPNHHNNHNRSGDDRPFRGGGGFGGGFGSGGFDGGDRGGGFGNSGGFGGGGFHGGDRGGGFGG